MYATQLHMCNFSDSDIGAFLHLKNFGPGFSFVYTLGCQIKIDTYKILSNDFFFIT